MSGFQTRLDRDNADREAMKARCKRAPAIVGSYQSALDAWQKYQKYSGLAQSAYAQYMRAGIGTATQRKHNVRWEAYSDVADEWQEVLHSWLRDMAQMEKDDAAAR